MTHMALVELEKAGILKFVISQNIDGLHLRSGIPREKLAELHGNSFMEICPSCGVEYLRDFEVETVGMKETSRRCSNIKCGSKLTDTVLDWEDALPPKEMNPSEKHCRKADVILCLGTSLQITPACNLPLKCLRGGGKIIIINLQETPKDKKASLVIRGMVDMVIAGVMELLNLKIPPFFRIDLLQITLTQGLSADKIYVNWLLRIGSVHGQKAILPFIKSVEVSFLEAEMYKSAILEKQPFTLKRRTMRSRVFQILLKLNFSDGCGCLYTQIIIPVNFNVSVDNFKHDKEAVIQELIDASVQDACSGQNAIVERKAILDPKGEVTVHAILTNIVTYSSKTSESTPVCNGDMERQNESVNGVKTSWRKRKDRS